MSLLRGQSDVSATVPMPTDRVDDASTVTNVSAETVTWFYVTSSAWASATGQDAGTLVWGKLVFDGVLNSNKAAVGNKNNTSLSLGASTRLDTLVSIPEDVLAAMQFMSPTDQKAEALKYLTANGYYAIDHRRGQIWGRPKATVADDTASYSYKAPVAGSSGPSANVAVTSIVPGTGATNLGKAEDAVHSSGDAGVLMLGVRKDAAASTATTDGDYTAPIFNSTGHQHVVEGFAPNAEDNTLGVLYTLEKPTASATNAVTLDTSSAAEASSVTKASAGRLYGFVFSNANGATRYLQFFNAASVPADTAIPFLVFKVGTGETLAVDFPKGIPFSTGICWCNSTTQNTKTIGSADSIANVFYT